MDHAGRPMSQRYVVFSKDSLKQFHNTFGRNLAGALHISKSFLKACEAIPSHLILVHNFKDGGPNF